VPGLILTLYLCPSSQANYYNYLKCDYLNKPITIKDVQQNLQTTTNNTKSQLLLTTPHDTCESTVWFIVNSKAVICIWSSSRWHHNQAWDQYGHTLKNSYANIWPFLSLFGLKLCQVFSLSVERWQATVLDDVMSNNSFHCWSKRIQFLNVGMQASVIVSLGWYPLNFCDILCLPYRGNSIIPGSAISTQYQHVTDKQTDGSTPHNSIDGAMHSVAWEKFTLIHLCCFRKK